MTPNDEPGFNYDKASMTKETELQDSEHLDPLETMIDQTLADSFPASDPPSWTLGRETKPS